MMGTVILIMVGMFLVIFASMYYVMKVAHLREKNAKLEEEIERLLAENSDLRRAPNRYPYYQTGDIGSGPGVIL